MTDLDQAVEHYLQFFDGLTDDRVEHFRQLSVPEVRYRDPLMDAQGIDAVITAMHGWFNTLSHIRFEGLSQARSDQEVMAHWHMHFQIQRMPKQEWTIDGVSRVTFNREGLVVEVVDYWDATPLLEGFPLLGRIVTLLKRLMG